MTSRLKRKLDNMGVDSSNVTESFCMIGTPLPPLEKADKNEFVPLWKQDVRDEKGRRRLHGAFTGGFSAGYFNTVGSKEGWTPATFKSSRNARANAAKTQRPEDFMDEEDLAELRESQNLVDSTEQDIVGGTAAEKGLAGDDSLAGVLQSLVPDARDSVGSKLLQRMGWRPGQGIGPRITYRQRKLQDLQAAGKPPTAADEEDMNDEEASKHLYAPRDTKTVVYRAKDNSFGLGYVPGQGLSEIIAGTSKDAAQGPQISAGFGLGALNDAEDDDVDVYDGGRPSLDKRGLAYHLGEDEDEEKVLLGAKQRSALRPSTASGPKPTQSAYFFSDGQPVLPGFKPAELPVVEDTWFEPPEVPADWEPDPKRVWEQNGSVKSVPLAAGTKGGQNIRAEERGAILGETPLAPRSVFDYLSSKDRERLKNMTSSKTGPTERAPTPPPEVKPEIPKIDPQIAAAALRGFQPFTTDPAKQARYTAYLQSQAVLSDPDAPPALAPQRGQSVEEFNKEVSDYAKAAQIFKPVTGAMASRFTSSTIMENIHHPKEGLHEADTEHPYIAAEDEKMEEVKEEESPKAHAARMGMFGPLTRETSVWVPAKLLCKRFGVKDPYPGGAPLPEEKGSAWSASEAAASAAASGPPRETLAITAGSASSGQEDKENVPTTHKDISNVGLGEDDDQGREILTYERPAMDIFKAIFASDDEESDDEAEELPVVEVKPVADKALSPIENGPGPHLAVVSSTKSAYKPQQHDDETFDISSFKPTFVPKAARAKEKTDDGASKEHKKKKKHKGAVVSFDVEEGGTGEQGLDVRPKKRKLAKDGNDGGKETKRKRKEAEPEEDEGMWVEKPPPVVVLKGASGRTATPDGQAASGVQVGRKRATDFFD